MYISIKWTYIYIHTYVTLVLTINWTYIYVCYTEKQEKLLIQRNEKSQFNCNFQNTKNLSQVWKDAHQIDIIHKCYIITNLRTNLLIQNQIGLKELISSKWNVKIEYCMLNARRSSHQWKVKIKIDDSLKSADRFFCQQEKKLCFFPFIRKVLLFDTMLKY